MFVFAADDSGKVNMNMDKICAYQTLYECLETVVQVNGADFTIF